MLRSGEYFRSGGDAKQAIFFMWPYSNNKKDSKVIVQLNLEYSHRYIIVRQNIENEKYSTCGKSLERNFVRTFTNKQNSCI